MHKKWVGPRAADKVDGKRGPCWWSMFVGTCTTPSHFRFRWLHGMLLNKTCTSDKVEKVDTKKREKKNHYFFLNGSK